jgi:hypothetical protein
VTTPWILVRRHLVSHWVRTLLTGAGLVVALFLYCLLVSLVTSLDAVVKESASDRLITQPIGSRPRMSSASSPPVAASVSYFPTRVRS